MFKEVHQSERRKLESCDVITDCLSAWPTTVPTTRALWAGTTTPHQGHCSNAQGTQGTDRSLRSLAGMLMIDVILFSVPQSANGWSYWSTGDSRILFVG